MKDKLSLLAAMIIVGSIGIFVNYINLSSAVIACSRAVIGTLFILIVMFVKHEKVNWQAVKKNLLWLSLSGIALGFNWILLFEAYRYTTVSVATMCYYMAPVFVVLLSPIVIKEKLTLVGVLSTVIAVIGAVLISGVAGLPGNSFEGTDLRGVGFGLSAALLYCSILFLNKKISGQKSLEKTFCQLFISAVVMIIYVLLTQDLSKIIFTTQSILLLFVVGIIHTGIVYVMFFQAIGKLPAQTASIISYMDPVTAVFLSVIILHETLFPLQLVGTVLILGATLFHELWLYRKRKS